MTAAELIDLMRSRGMTVLYQPEWWGSDELIELDDLLSVLADPLAFEAAREGVTPEQLVEFGREEREQQQGKVCPQCIATTKRGRRCRNPTTEGYANPRDYWDAVARGGYCRGHGGKR